MFYMMTEKDEDLLRPLNGRDPMGILPIWQHRARDVVPHITAASRHLDGFHVLLAALAWWPEFANTYKQPAKQLTPYFLLVEQAFARACTLNKTTWNLPGKRRLTTGNPVFIGLKPEHHLLGGQLQNGVWGIYRSVAESAGLIDGNNAVKPDIVGKIRNKSEAVKGLWPALDKALNQQSMETVKIAERPSHHLVGELSNIIEMNPFAKLIYNPFLAPAKPVPTTSVVALMREQIRLDPFNPETFVLQDNALIKDRLGVFKHIIKCERYIATIESIFDWLCSGLSTNVEDAAGKLRINMDILRSALGDFRGSGEYPSGSLAYKRKIMLERLNLSSKKRLIETILDMHKDVSESRNNMPWITIESGRFDIVVLRGPPAEGQLNPISAWRNSYYLDSFFNLTKQFYKAGVRE